MLKTYTNIEQGTEEWHDLRAKYYKSASRTSTVLGLSPFSNMEALAKEIKFNIKPFYSNAMKLGNDLEEMVRDKADEYFSDTFVPEVGVRDGFLASLDGINFNADRIIEIKVSSRTYDDVKLGKIPEHYMAQIQHQMFVFDVFSAYLVAYSTDKNEIIVSEEIKRDPEFINKMIAGWKAFDEFMETYELPKEEIRDDVEWELMATKFIDINAQIKLLEAEKKECQTTLISLASGVKSKGFGVSVYSTTRKTIDNKAIIKDFGVDTSKYEKESTSWSVRG